MADGSLFYHNRLVIPATSKFIELILHECHDSRSGGHSGILKTYKRIFANCYWKGMRKRVEEYVARCQVCQTHKYST